MASRQLPLRALLSALPRQSATRLAPPLLNRAYHFSPRLSLPYKDDQDRQTLKPRPSDSTKSGSDLEPSDHYDASFNPKENRPEKEKESMQRECNGSPLEFSGANQEISEHSNENAGSKEDKKTKSGGSGGKKHGKVGPKK